MKGTTRELKSLDDLPFSVKFKMLRRTRGYSVEQFSDISGLSLYQISALEQRDKEPDIIELKLICKALNVSPKIFINF